MGRIHIVVALWLVAASVSAGGCGPSDTRDACERAEEALNAAAGECGLEQNYDNSCDSLEADVYDCSAHYEAVAASARCEDNSVVFDSGAPCT